MINVFRDRRIKFIGQGFQGGQRLGFAIVQGRHGAQICRRQHRRLGFGHGVELWCSFYRTGVQQHGIQIKIQCIVQCAHFVGGGQRVVLCCRHAIVRRTCHQGGRHGFCLQQAVQIIRQLGQIGRGAVLAGRFILYRRRRQAGFQRGQMGFNLLAIALGQVGGIHHHRRLGYRGAGFAAGKLAEQGLFKGKIQSIGLISDFRQRFAARWRGRGFGHRQHRRHLALAITFSTGQQLANKSVQFFTGRQGRRCFISGRQLLRQHRRCVDLAVVLGTGQ